MSVLVSARMAAVDAHADASRHGAAALATLAGAVLLWALASQPSWLAKPEPTSTPIELMLEQLVPMPESAPPPPAPVAPPKAAVAPPTDVAAPPVLSAKPSVSAEPATAPAPMPAVPEVARSVAPTTPAAMAPPSAKAEPVSASIEAEFVARIRAQLNASKRYPTGREASMQRPQGKVRVWFVLGRNGTLIDSGLLDSSNSLLLDNAALSTVRRAALGAWPNEAWPGQEQHKFSVELEFLPPSS